MLLVLVGFSGYYIPTLGTFFKSSCAGRRRGDCEDSYCMGFWQDQKGNGKAFAFDFLLRRSVVSVVYNHTPVHRFARNMAANNP